MPPEIAKLPDGWEPIARAIRQYCLRVYGCEPLRVSVPLLHGPTVELPMPQWGLHLHCTEDAAPPATEAPQPSEPLREVIIVKPSVEVPLERQRIRQAWHSDDWREVHIEGRRWMLSPSPAMVFRALWQAALEGKPDIDQRALLRLANSTSGRVPDLFKKVPDWQKLITTVEPLHYRLTVADRLKDLLEEDAQREAGLIEE